MFSALFNAVKFTCNECLDCFDPLHCNGNPWWFHLKTGLDSLEVAAQVTFKKTDDSCSQVIKSVSCDIVTHDFVFDCFHDSGFGLQYLLHLKYVRVSLQEFHRFIDPATAHEGGEAGLDARLSA